MSKKVKNTIEPTDFDIVIGGDKLTFKVFDRELFTNFLFDKLHFSDAEAKSLSDGMEAFRKEFGEDVFRLELMKQSKRIGENFLLSPDLNTDTITRINIHNKELEEVIKIFKDNTEEIKRKLAESQEEIKELKRELKSKGPLMVRQSEHISDNLLQYNTPVDLFSMLEPNVQADLRAYNISKYKPEEERPSMLSDLTGHEMTMITAFSILLGTNSQNTKEGEPDFYTGNAKISSIQYGSDAAAIMPGLSFTLYQFAKILNHGKPPSGQDIDNAETALYALEGKKQYLSHTETYIGRDIKNRKVKTEVIISGHLPLFQIVQAQITQTVEGDPGPPRKKKETIINLNPIFSRQIATKYINIPVDIIKRTAIANGSSKVPSSVLLLREYLQRAHAHGMYKVEINTDNLKMLLAPTAVKARQKGRVNTAINKSIETCKALGLLINHEISTGKAGQEKYTFCINEEWPGVE